MQCLRVNLAAGLCAFLACTVVACDTSRLTTNGSTTSAAPAGSDDAGLRTSLAAKESRGPRLVRIYFNPYTDSIKTVLNYYVNVEGQFNDGSFLPLDTTDIILRCDRGTLAGNEWIVPKKIDFEKVTFIAEARSDPRLRDTVTLWIQKRKDPRDAPDYKDPDEERIRK